MMKLFLTTLICVFLIAENVRAQYHIAGKVIDSVDKKPLIGATIALQEEGKTIKTDDNGTFILSTKLSQATIVISSIGYNNKDAFLTAPFETPIIISLARNMQTLSEVNIVSTGYQSLPKDRATGSFEVIGNELLNRRVSTNLIDRLEDVTPGLVFNRSRSSASPFNIRGQSGIFSNALPLIVIDNFVYDGDLGNINPNDVESVTVLKDAAAASIWGARAGNGVIVITTKRGKSDQPPTVNFNSNITVGSKPYLFYLPRMNTSDFIDIEKQLFANGYYQWEELSASKTPLTPVVELLIQSRDGLMDPAEAERQIEALKQFDVRNDLDRYFYRNSLNQQYAFNISGGGRNHQYYYAGGYDKEDFNLRQNGSNRITLNAANTFQFFNSRLELKSDIYYTRTKDIRDRNIPIADDIGMYSGNQFSIYPYAQLVDENGNPLAITRGYRTGFVESTVGSGLLDWQYRPLEELYLGDNYTQTVDYRLNTHLRYNIVSGLSFDVLYQFAQTSVDRHNRQDMQSYFTRNLINSYTQLRSDGNFDYPIPVGDILDKSFGRANNHNVRAQLNYNLSRGDHDLSAIAGYELKDYNIATNNYRDYGYDPNQATVGRVDYISTFPQYYNDAIRLVIPNANSVSDLTDRFISYFANAAYTFRNRYTLSSSARFDRSNLFGVRTNQQGVPLWSVGGMWTVSNENFYYVDWLPMLKVRGTFGYNGNIDKSLSAFTTAQYFSNNVISHPYAFIVNPPNPELRWERIRTINLGLDFATRESRLSGSFEFYTKKGIDLIGDASLRPSTGLTRFRGNYAQTATRGVDLSLNSRNLKGQFGWNTNLILSTIAEKVTAYDIVATTSNYVTNADAGTQPLEGKPLFAIYGYRWGGLDPETGNPQGYVNGELSQNYGSIISTTTPEDLVYYGPSRPTLFGALRNTFTCKNFSLSANISYRFGYYFRLNGISYNSVLSAQGYINGADYPLRWQEPGDELHTHVPSMPTTFNNNRDAFYRYSEVLIEKGDHIRLQDVQIDYQLSRDRFPALPFRTIKIYAYANNLGIIWKRTNSQLDPDYMVTTPPVRTIAFGINIGI